MTDRRPRPHPEPPADLQPESERESMPAPISAGAAPSAPPHQPRRTRSERRQAESAGRRMTLRRRVPRALAGVSVVAGVLLFVIVFDPNDNPAAPPPTAAAHTAPAAAARGAGLADPSLVAAFLGGAASDIAAVTSYDYRTLDDALTAGLSVTTGSYRNAYRAALTGDLAQTARAQHVVHTFDVIDLGIGEINPSGTQAKVLVFGRQSVTDDSSGANPIESPVTLCATIRKIGDRFLISDLVEGASAGLPPGGPDLRVAAEAGRSEVVNLLSYRRANFDLDLQRALAGATSPLRDDIQKNAASTQAAMNSGNYDLTGAVTAIAVVRADVNTVSLLVAADATRLPDGAAQPVLTHPRYDVTVTRTSQGWAASRVTPVDGS